MIPSPFRTRDLTTGYLIGLLLIALLICTSFLIEDENLEEQSHDALLIGLSGELRTYSQKLAKEALRFGQSEDMVIKNRLQIKIGVIEAKISRIHRGLRRGDKKLGLPGKNSEEVNRIFEELDPHFEKIVKAAKAILYIDYEELPSLTHRSPLVQNIVTASSPYLDNVDRIVGQYEREARKRVEDHRLLERKIALSVFLLLLFIGFFIFRPMVRRVRDSYKELEKNRDQLEELVKRRTVQLARTNKELEEFASAVSHDLKAPLRGISSLALWIEEDYSRVLGEEGKENLQLLTNRSKRMHDLIDGILHYSRVGRVQHELEHLDSGEIAEEVIKTLESQSPLKIHIGSPLPSITYGRIHLELILQNLLSNALSHSGQKEGVVTLSCQRGAEGHIFCVKDEGVGIDKKHFDRIFRMFQTIGEGQGGKSSGIGLPLVKKIVTAYGGKVWVESKVGEGSVFYFTVLYRIRKEKGF